MNLVIDIGNTWVKFAIFKNQKLVIDQKTEASTFLLKIKEVFKAFPKIDNAILSSVKKLDREVAVLSLFCRVHVLSNKSKIPFKNKYATPKTLGVDRLAVVTAAFYTNPRRNTLVIDAGTCITYDIINAHGEYLGGAISPGLSMRYSAMHNQTDGLPLLQIEELTDFIGTSTKGSMHGGVINGTIQEVDGVIKQYEEHFKDLTVILTGGDAHFFAKRLKNSIFANSKFLLEGLNYLLEYNKS